MSYHLDSLSTLVAPIFGEFDPASNEELHAAEKSLGFELPSVLRLIQLRFGRCMFAGEASISSGGETFGVFTLFGCKGSVGNLVLDVDEHSEMKSQGLIPFADDMFNNRFVWRSSDGGVFFLDYTRHDPARKIAVSIEDFFSRVEVVPD